LKFRALLKSFFLTRLTGKDVLYYLLPTLEAESEDLQCSVGLYEKFMGKYLEDGNKNTSIVSSVLHEK